MARAKVEGEAGITIPPMNLEEVIVRIVGTEPLLTNRWSERAISEMEDKQTGKAKAVRGFRHPEKEWQEKIWVIGLDGRAAPSHLIEEGERYGFPSAGIKKALVSAGGRFAGGTMTELRGILNISGEILEINGVPHRRRDISVIQGKTPITVYRPEFPTGWTIDVPIRFNASLMSREQVLNLFNIAGFSVGIGAFRPERSGICGQFKVDAILGRKSNGKGS